MESTTDLKIKRSILPVEYLIQLKRTTYMWKLRNCLLPAFNPLDVTNFPLGASDKTVEAVASFLNLYVTLEN